MSCPLTSDDHPSRAKSASEFLTRWNRFRVLTRSLLATYLTLFLISIFPSFLTADPEAWHRSADAHFEVYQKVENASFAKIVLAQAEKDLDRILTKLSFDEPREEWRGENRIRIVIFRDQSSYEKKRDVPEWASGDANYETRTIATFKNSETFLTSTLSHEIAHLVLYELTSEFGNVPKWLHEGFAIACEGERREGFDQLIKEAARHGRLLPLKLLTIVDPKVQTHGGANTYYSEADAFVRFLIAEYGAERFKKFILSLAQGKSFEEAIRRAYKGKVEDHAELEAEFFATFA